MALFSHLFDEGHVLPDGKTYKHTFGTLFSGLGAPAPDLTQRAVIEGGVDDLAGLPLTFEEIDNISFGVAYTAQGSGRVEVDAIRVRVYYRAAIANDTLPAKRAKGLSGVAESPGGIKVAVGVDGKIMRKPANNPTWSTVASGTTVSLNAVEWVGDRFIAVGVGGIALDGGADGSAWTRIETGAVASLWAIRRIPDTLRAIAVGNDDYSFHRSRQGEWSK